MKRNYQACLLGMGSCQVGSLTPTEKQAVRVAAMKRNYQACLLGIGSCQMASLTPAEKEAMREAVAKRNYQACLLGIGSCQAANLTPAERQAVKEAAAQRAQARALAPPAAGGWYKGYPCTVDCSGHEAGYDWAEANDIDDESDCTGNSQSFIEGCMAYVEENAENGDDSGDVDGENEDDD